MNICLKHQQQYAFHLWCVYCGRPTKTSDSTTMYNTVFKSSAFINTDAIRDMKADIWDAGFTAGKKHASECSNNPYRENK